MSLSLFIGDGYTLSFTVKSRPTVPALTIKYRPALPERLYQWRADGQAAKDAKGKLANDIKLLTDQIVSWDAGVPIEPGTLAKMWPWLVAELLDVVAGYTIEEQASAEKN